MEWFHMQMEASFGCTAFARGVSLCRLARSEPWRVPSLAAADARLEKKQKQKKRRHFEWLASESHVRGGR